MSPRLQRILDPLVAPLAGVGVGLSGAALVLGVLGYNPFETAAYALRQCLGNGFNLGNVLHRTTQLIFPAVAVAFALRAGLFNIGAEGQLYVASFCVAVAALGMENWPLALELPALLAVAVVTGGLWALIPGVLKAFRGAHEVIATIMLNWIAFAGIRVFYRPGSTIIVPGTVNTHPIAERLRLPTFERLGVDAFAGSPFNLSVALAAAALVLYWWVTSRTRFGLQLRAVGANPEASRAAGIRVRGMIVGSMVISGAFAGLLAIDSVLGWRGFFGEDSASGLGFTGIAVALLAGCNAGAIPLAAFFFGFLDEAGVVLKMRRVPRETIEIVQALVILAVACAPFVASRVRLRMAARAALRDEAGGAAKGVAA